MTNREALSTKQKDQLENSELGKELLRLKEELIGFKKERSNKIDVVHTDTQGDLGRLSKQAMESFLESMSSIREITQHLAGDGIDAIRGGLASLTELTQDPNSRLSQDEIAKIENSIKSIEKNIDVLINKELEKLNEQIESDTDNAPDIIPADPITPISTPTPTPISTPTPTPISTHTLEEIINSIADSPLDMFFEHSHAADLQSRISIELGTQLDDFLRAVTKEGLDNRGAYNVGQNSGKINSIGNGILKFLDQQTSLDSLSIDKYPALKYVLGGTKEGGKLLDTLYDIQNGSGDLTRISAGFRLKFQHAIDVFLDKEFSNPLVYTKLQKHYRELDPENLDDEKDLLRWINTIPEHMDRDRSGNRTEFSKRYEDKVRYDGLRMSFDEYYAQHEVPLMGKLERVLVTLGGYFSMIKNAVGGLWGEGEVPPSSADKLRDSIREREGKNKKRRRLIRDIKKNHPNLNIQGIDKDKIEDLDDDDIEDLYDVIRGYTTTKKPDFMLDAGYTLAELKILSQDSENITWDTSDKDNKKLIIKDSAGSIAAEYSYEKLKNLPNNPTEYAKFQAHLKFPESLSIDSIATSEEFQGIVNTRFRNRIINAGKISKIKSTTFPLVFNDETGSVDAEINWGLGFKSGSDVEILNPQELKRASEMLGIEVDELVKQMNQGIVAYLDAETDNIIAQHPDAASTLGKNGDSRIQSIYGIPTDPDDSIPSRYLKSFGSAVSGAASSLDRSITDNWNPLGIATGFIEGGGKFVDDIAHTIANPIDTFKGSLSLVGMNFFDGPNKDELSWSFDHFANTWSRAADEILAGEKLKQGKWFSALGETVFNLGSFVVTGGAAAGIKGTGIASRVARVGLSAVNTAVNPIGVAGKLVLKGGKTTKKILNKRRVKGIDSDNIIELDGKLLDASKLNLKQQKKLFKEDGWEFSVNDASLMNLDNSKLGILYNDNKKLLNNFNNKNKSIDIQGIRRQISILEDKNSNIAWYQRLRKNNKIELSANKKAIQQLKQQQSNYRLNQKKIEIIEGHQKKIEALRKNNLEGLDKSVLDIRKNAIAEVRKINEQLNRIDSFSWFDPRKWWNKSKKRKLEKEKIELKAGIQKYNKIQNQQLKNINKNSSLRVGGLDLLRTSQYKFEYNNNTYKIKYNASKKRWVCVNRDNTNSHKYYNDEQLQRLANTNKKSLKITKDSK